VNLAPQDVDPQQLLALLVPARALAQQARTVRPRRRCGRGHVRFERSPSGVRLIYSANGAADSIDATVAVVAVGWVAATAGLKLDRAGVRTGRRGYVEVDSQQRTAVPHIFAAGDVTGRAMVVHEAVREAVLAATNAVLGASAPLPTQVSPIGSFTDPEYASVGVTEAAAREGHDVMVATTQFDSLPRPIIDGRPTGFCKLIADRQSHRVLGCHIAGERAVELAQLAATAMAAQMPVEQLALVPYSFPTLRERARARRCQRRDRTRPNWQVGGRSPRRHRLSRPRVERW
jgi:pyruvate/2-oxoglutarate dehydrogenase complex dihydrolipoamide dehydrogenase (E3) component